jgi:hypothetical protein
VEYLKKECLNNDMHSIFLCKNESFIENEQAKKATIAVRQV